jgi:hypothetical protein
MVFMLLFVLDLLLVLQVQDIKKKADAAQQAAEGIAAAAEGNVGAAVSALQGVATVFGACKSQSVSRAHSRVPWVTNANHLAQVVTPTRSTAH